MPIAVKDSEKSICSIGLVIVLLWLLITWLSHGIGFDWLPIRLQSGFAYEIENDFMPTAAFFVLHLLCWTLLLFGLGKIRRRASISRRTLLGIWGVTVLLRLIAICGEPIHENDFYRYLWDGQVSISGTNPYRYAPEMATKLQVLSELREENSDFHSRIGHPEIPTIYPPVAQGVFALSAVLFGWSVMGLKGIILCFDLGIVLLLIAILRKLGKNPGWVILYAWNPLVVKEFANSVHYDAVPVFFCLLALWFALSDLSTIRKSLWVGITLALGTMAKYFAILFLPVLLFAIAREKGGRISIKSTKLWTGCAVFVAVVVAGFVPFFLWNDVGVSGVFAGLLTYTERWQYSPGIFALIERMLAYFGCEAHFISAKIIVALILGVIALWIALIPTRDGRHLSEKCFCIVSALFVLSPTVFPWYYCWVLAFAIFKPRFSWLLLGALLPLNYLDFHSASDIPIAHAQWAGFYFIPSMIWVIFAMAWFSERRLSKSG